MAWCAGVLTGSLATCPNMALQPLIIRSDTGARPVRKETSELRTKSCHLIPRILRWHFMWKDSMALMSLASEVHVSDAYSRIDKLCVVTHNLNKLEGNLSKRTSTYEWRKTRAANLITEATHRCQHDTCTLVKIQQLCTNATFTGSSHTCKFHLDHNLSTWKNKIKFQNTQWPVMT